MRVERTALAFLEAHGAGAIEHPGGTLIAHLCRTADLLASWGASPALTVAGLCPGHLWPGRLPDGAPPHVAPRRPRGGAGGNRRGDRVPLRELRPANVPPTARSQRAAAVP